MSEKKIITVVLAVLLVLGIEARDGINKPNVFTINNLIQNGDFALPAINNGSWQFFRQLNGW